MIKLKSILLSEQGKRKTGYNAFTQADGNKQGDDPFEERNYPPKLKGLGAVKKGDFSITSAADPANKGIGAYFKRNTAWLRSMIKLAVDNSVRRGMPNKPSRNLGLILAKEAVKQNLIKPDVVPVTPETPTPLPPTVVKIDIDPLTVTDPFEFDKVTKADGKLEISETALKTIDTFIASIGNVKTTYGDEIYKQYIQFLIDSKPFVTGYASRDADPKQKIQGGYAPCRGSGDGTRGAYNVCLSQKRAAAIRSYIESKLPELAGAFEPIGKGETVDFGGTSWPDPGATSESSKPNRRFEVQLPSFNSERLIPAPPTPPAPQPPEPAPVPKQKTKKTWADWGLDFGSKSNPYILQVGKELNLPDHPNLEIPVGIDTNSGYTVIPNFVLNKLKSKTGITNFDYTQPIDLLKYIFNRDYTNTGMLCPTSITANSVTISQPDLKKAAPFVFKWGEAPAGTTNENLFIYLQAESKLAILKTDENGIYVGHVTPMVVDTSLADF